MVEDLKNKIINNIIMLTLLENLIEFVLQQNIINSYIGVTLGASAFVLLNSISTNLLVPILNIFTSKFNISDLKFIFLGSEFNYGIVLNSLISFIIMILVLYFLVVVPYNNFNDTLGLAKITNKQCPYCKTLINNDATVCPACTRNV